MINEDLYKKLRLIYEEKRDLIKARLTEFQDVLDNGGDKRIFKELVFCILTSAAGPKMGQMSVDAINGLLMEGSEGELYERLQGVHKYPERASYIVHTREYLKKEFDFILKDLVLSFKGSIERRDFFASNKNIMRMIYDFGLVDNPKPPTTKRSYIEVENKVKAFSDKLGIEIDDLDLLLWSVRTGHIPK